jgi:hypothetical protein
VTLKPGDPHTIEYGGVSGASVDPSCGTGSVFPGVWVSSEVESDDLRGRGLVSADLWLIERLSGGERTVQALTVRVMRDRQGAFYFDRIPGPDWAFVDLSGHLTPRLHAARLEVELWVETRIVREDERRRFVGIWGQNHAATVDPKDDEIVEVMLPTINPASDDDGKFVFPQNPFAGRTFAIRIRAKQLR